MDITYLLKNKIIVSVQAACDEPLYEEGALLAMMKSVVNGGAQALRLAGTRDIKNAKKYFDLPIIGITKPEKLPENWLNEIYITPSVQDVEALAEAGADIIAFDATNRQRTKNSLPEIISAVKGLNKLSMADIATFDDAKKAIELGVDIVSTTLSGYTLETANGNDEPDFILLQKIVENFNVPVILEGRIWEISQVKKAFELGAFAVVIGSAITRPQLITNRFLNWRQL